MDRSSISSPAVERHRETVERYRQSDSREQARQLQAKWDFTRTQLDAFFENLGTQPDEVFSKEELYPNVPLCVIAIVQGVFGFAAPTQPIDSGALMEALTEKLSGWGQDGMSGTSQLGQSIGQRERVPA